MPSKYLTSRAAKVRSRNNLPKKKTTKPNHTIPVVINSKLTIYIDCESKREETILKYKK